MGGIATVAKSTTASNLFNVDNTFMAMVIW